MQKRTYIFTSLFLLTLFITYQVSITMFSHVHYINGVMIVHSHPSSDNQHTHTDGQILTFAHVSQWMGTEPVFVTMDEVSFSVFDSLECKRIVRFLTEQYSHCICLRAPPFFF